MAPAEPIIDNSAEQSLVRPIAPNPSSSSPGSGGQERERRGVQKQGEEEREVGYIHLGLFVVLEQRKLVRGDRLRRCMLKTNDAIKCHVMDHARGKQVSTSAHERGWMNVYKMSPGFHGTVGAVVRRGEERRRKRTGEGGV